MYIEWYDGATDPAVKEQIDREIVSAKPVLDRIKRITEKKERTLDRQEMNIEVYNMPNWDVRQAHKNGQRSSLDWMKTLVDLDQQKTPTYDGQFTNSADKQPIIAGPRPQV